MGSSKSDRLKTLLFRSAVVVVALVVPPAIQYEIYHRPFLEGMALPAMVLMPASGFMAIVAVCRLRVLSGVQTALVYFTFVWCVDIFLAIRAAYP